MKKRELLLRIEALEAEVAELRNRELLRSKIIDWPASGEKNDCLLDSLDLLDGAIKDGLERVAAYWAEQEDRRMDKPDCGC